MKRLLILFICLCLCAGLFPMTATATPQWPSDVSIQADAGIVMDSDTGTMLCGRNIDQPYYPANITKILTALIVLEQCDLSEMVTFSHDDVCNVEAGSSSAGIDGGDVLTVRGYPYAPMLASVSESTNALAYHVSGSREAFAQLMNKKAQSLDCTGSHFNNPSGLNDENHYATAHGMALIASAAIQNPEFLTINGTHSYQLTPTKRTPEGGYVANHHKVLDKNEAVYYPGAFVGKTGYTSPAGNTLVTCAKKNDMILIAVMLSGHQSHYSDAKALLDFGFRNFQSLQTVDYETRCKSLENDMTIADIASGDSISLELNRGDHVVIPRDTDFTDTQSALTYDLDDSHPRTAVACIRYTHSDRPVGSVYLYSPGLKGSAVSLTSQDASGASAVSIDQNGETDIPVPLGSSSPGDISGLQDGPEALSHVEAPHGQQQPPDPAPCQDITSKERATTSIRIPANTPAILGIASSLAVIVTIVAAVRIHMYRKEEEDLCLRRRHRLERLEDIGLSSTDFEKLVAQRRISSPSLGRKGKDGRGRRCRRSFFR